MEEGDFDLISSLPLELQQCITSFLTLKEAVRTCSLSTNWRNMWKPIQLSLKFDSNLESCEASQEIQEVIGMILRSCDYPKQWKLYFDQSKKEITKLKKELVILATKGVDRELYVEFFDEKKSKIEFNLKLESTRLCNIYDNMTSSKAVTVSFSVLKTLCLRSVTSNYVTFVSALFSNCHLLESLKLEKCRGLDCLDIETSSLRYLIVEDCTDIVSMKIVAPNLQLFKYRGSLPQIKLGKTSNLVDVILNLKDGPGLQEFDCEEILYFLASFKEVETLTTSGWLFEWLCCAGVIFGKLEFRFNNLKELKWIDSCVSKAKSDSLACFLNICPILEKLFIDIDCSLISIHSPLFHQYWHEPHLWMDFRTMKSNTLQLKHLKYVRFMGFTNREDELLLKDLLLEKAIVLQTMTVASPQSGACYVVNTPKNMLNVSDNIKEPPKALRYFSSIVSILSLISKFCSRKTTQFQCYDQPLTTICWPNQYCL